MLGPEMTLAAALRDAAHRDGNVRAAGVRNLAPAMLAELQRPGPAWRADEDHAQGREVRAALERALVDEDPQVRGLAAVGLGVIGHADVVAIVEPWIDGTGDDPASEFLRETAIITLSFVGTAAPPEHGELKATIAARLREALASAAPDVRFQAALALVEVEGEAATTTLLATLARENHPRVREQIVVALAHLPALDEVACARLGDLVRSDEDGPTSIGLEAALALAANGRPDGATRLTTALRERTDRDRALEALAVLGPQVPAETVRAIAKLARGWLTPSITRVRAAYAWAAVQGARAQPEHPANRLLRRLAWHPRPAVREAVADAHRALAEPPRPRGPAPAA